MPRHVRLHALSALGGVLGAATIVGSFLFGWPSIIAVIINYVTRGDVRGTWLETHWRWQLRTFWFAAPGRWARWLLVLTVIGIPLAWSSGAVLGLWVLYRVIRGWLALVDKRGDAGAGEGSCTTSSRDVRVGRVVVR